MNVVGLKKLRFILLFISEICVQVALALRIPLPSHSMTSHKRQRAEMTQEDSETSVFGLLSLPDHAVVEVMRHLDARSLVQLQQTAQYFSRKDPVTRLPLTDHIALLRLQQLCRSNEEASRFRSVNAPATLRSLS
jgi:hypothetical protein